MYKRSRLKPKCPILRRQLLAFLTAALSLLFLIACNRKEKMKNILGSSENIQLINEVKSWLRINGGYLSEGVVLFEMIDTKGIKGELSWDLAKVDLIDGAEIIKVPYFFKGHSFSKNSRILGNFGKGDLPIMADLYFKKQDGKIEGVVKISAYNNNVNKELREKYTSVYTLDMNHIADKQILLTRIFKLKRDEINDFNKLRNASSNCEEISYTYSYIEQCYGDMSSTVCVFKKRTITRYKCLADFEREEEEVDWIDNDDLGYGGWIEYEEEEAEFANQDIIDSLRGNLCAQEVLKQLPNINNKAKEILQNIFGVNEDVNIKFSIDTTLSPNIDGDTKCGGSASYFNCTVRLNKAVLNQASKDYIAAIFIHEAMHAYINYQRTILDSTTFKNKFPIYWKYLGNDAHHNEMANSYVSMIAGVIMGFNPSLQETNAIALAWGGLDMTTAWKSKPDTNFVKQVNAAGRNPVSADYLTFGFKKCP